MQSRARRQIQPSTTTLEEQLEEEVEDDLESSRTLGGDDLTYLPPSLPFLPSTSSYSSISSTPKFSNQSPFSSLYSLPNVDRQDADEGSNERETPTQPSITTQREEAATESQPREPLTSIDLFATLFRGDPDEDTSTGNGVVEVLRREGLTTLLLLLETSGLLNFLISGERGPYILLGPSEQAFARLSRQELRQVALTSDLSYHIIPLQGLPAPEVKNDSFFDTLLGSPVRFNVYAGDYVYVNGVRVVRGDVHFRHGTIHVINKVLSAPVGDLTTVLVARGPSYTRLNTLLSSLHLPMKLQDESYTLLAPSDSSITSKGYSWSRLLMGSECEGRELMARHIIKGSWYTLGLVHQRTLTTLAGTPITFRRDADGIVSANGVPLRTSNLTASNGVVHLLADVLPESDIGTDITRLPLPLPPVIQPRTPIRIQGPIPSIIPPIPSPPSPPSAVPDVSELYETPEDFSTVHHIPPSPSAATPKSPPPTFTPLENIPKSSIPDIFLASPVAKLMTARNQLHDLLRFVDCGGRPVSLKASQAILRSLPDEGLGFVGYQRENEVVADHGSRKEVEAAVEERENSIVNTAFLKSPSSTTKGQGEGTRQPPPPLSLSQQEDVGVGAWQYPRPREDRRIDIVGLLRELNLTLFSRMVERSDLSFVLSLDGPWTVFAPSDSALTSIPRDAFRQIVSQPPFLRRLVSYHLSPGSYSSASFTHHLHVPTLHSGHSLLFTRYTDGPAAHRWVVGGSVITSLDHQGSNGIVHVLDRVLYPPYGDIPTTLSLSPILTIFTALINSHPPLLRLLSRSGPFTLFVPSDAALHNTSIPRDPDALESWVRKHLVEDAWYTSGFSNTWPLTSTNNHTLSTSSSTNQDKVTVNGVLIAYADITASNGVLHILQSPLASTQS